MTQITLTYEEARALLERAVSGVGEEYVYGRVPDELFPEGACAYFNPATEAPSCIVGHVLAYKGVTYEDARKGRWNIGVNADSLVSSGMIKCDAETRDLLETVQCNQDGGLPWADAVRLAVAEDCNA